MVMIVFFILVVMILIFLLQVILSGKLFQKKESLTPLESGFESLFSSLSISAPFFFLALLFVLFDMELVLFFPGVASLFLDGNSFLIWGFVNFVILITLLIEWGACGLKWQV